MPSSTSSSSTYAADRAPPGRWGLTWLVAAGLVLGVLAVAEVALRRHGHVPSVVDDQHVWSSVRDRVCQGPVVALVGASRIQTDIDMDVLRREFPKYTPLMLAVENTSHVLTLHDLAQEECFAGIVLCSVRVPLRRTGPVAPSGPLQDAKFIEAYRHGWSPRLQAETWLRTRLQSHLTLVHPEVGLRGALIRMARGRSMAVPMHLQTSADRSRQVDFARVDVARLRSMAATSLKGYEPISIAEWTAAIDKWEPDVATIQRRGGRVAYVHFPVGHELKDAMVSWDLRARYWSILEARTKAVTLHVQDYEELSGFVPPDTSHLDMRDRTAFTERLVQRLRDKGLLR